MSTLVLICGNVFDGVSDTLAGPAEILVDGNRIAKIERHVARPPGTRVIDLSDRPVSPGFIDTHVHLTMDAANLAQQTLQSSAATALKGHSPAREYMGYGLRPCAISAALIRNGRRSTFATRSTRGLYSVRGFLSPRTS